MLRIDRELMESYSTKTGFQVDVVEKVYRLMNLLKEINKVANLKDNLVLKGGTAINFIYFDVPRLSVDIDVDYIGSAKKDRMLRDRKQIDKVLGRLFKKQGFNQEKRKYYALSQYILNYTNTAGNNDKIKMEINFLNRVPVFKPLQKSFGGFLGFEKANVSTLQVEELFGRKLRALITRGASRDLYDAYRLLVKKLGIDLNALRKSFIFYLCCHGDPRKISPNLVERISQKDIKTDLLPLLRKGEKIKAKEMKSKVLPLLEKFLTFESNEEKFIEELYDNKNNLPELLFKNLDYNKKLQNHPGVKWRIKNL